MDKLKKLLAISRQPCNAVGFQRQAFPASVRTRTDVKWQTENKNKQLKQKYNEQNYL